MNFTSIVGWYYKSPHDRAAAWTSAHYLHVFLSSNASDGPFAADTTPELLLPGDVIQLSFEPGKFSHSVMVVQTKGASDPDTILVAAHSDDSDNRPLSSYWPVALRYLHIEAR